jgi:hypothetical protein
MTQEVRFGGLQDDGRGGSIVPGRNSILLMAAKEMGYGSEDDAAGGFARGGGRRRGLGFAGGQPIRADVCGE